MRTRFPTIPVLSGLLLCCVFVALAASGGGYTLDPYTIDGGGGMSSGGSYGLIGGIAQAEVGTQVGGSYSVSGGFWAGLPKDTPMPTATPVPGDQLLVNGSFEQYSPQFAPKKWTRRFVTADKVRCNTKKKNFAYVGSCAYRFIGSQTEKSVIQQDVKLANFTLEALDTLQFTAMADVRPALTTGSRIRIIVQYKDGSPKAIFKLPLQQTSGYQMLSTNIVLSSDQIKFIRVIVEYKAKSGAAFIDRLSLFKPDSAPGFASLPPYGELTPVLRLTPATVPDLRGGQ